jgi:transcriptional regulator with PAS, ATPase and Fis domain
VSDRVTPALVEYYHRAKSYAKNALDAGVDYFDFVEAMKLAVIDAAMEKAKNNKTIAAEILRIDRSTLQRNTSNKIEHKMRHNVLE